MKFTKFGMLIGTISILGALLWIILFVWAVEPNLYDQQAEAETVITNLLVIPVTISVYRSGPTEGWGSGCITYDGTDICPLPDENICAVSPDILAKIPLGNIVELTTLNGFWRGTCTIRDRTHSRFKNRVDLLIEKDVPINLFKDSELIWIQN